MRKLIFILFLALLSCGSDDDEGCKCQGKFARLNSEPGTYFYADDVDCDTGQPMLDIQNQGEIGETNPAFYYGCNN